jgi:DNA polymerase III alpha subunit (gram-positive type)
VNVSDKKIAIIDIETSGIFCGEDGKKPANILRVDATKIENGKLGETFSSYVSCRKIIPKRIVDLTGINNETLKGAPRIKTVLNKFKDFIEGYEIYALYSKFVNKFLLYYGNKNGVSINLAKEDNYNEISKFINKRELREYLKNTTDLEPLALAKLLVED